MCQTRGFVMMKHFQEQITEIHGNNYNDKEIQK